MIFIGIANFVHWEVFLAFTHILYRKHYEVEAYGMFKVLTYGLISLFTIAHAKFMVTTEHAERLVITRHLQIAGYVPFILAWLLQDYTLGIVLASFASLIQAFALIYGECTVLGFFKAIPQEMITTYSQGKMIAELIGLVAVASGPRAMPYAFILFFLVAPYYWSFIWIDERRK